MWNFILFNDVSIRKGLNAFICFWVMFMAIVEYAMHTPDMAYQITKAIVVNAVVWFYF